MKKFFVFIFTAMILLSDAKYILNASEVNGKDDKRACWISFLDIQDYLKDLTEEEYIQKIDYMYDLIIQNNMNTVIFHVRPMADAVYPSEIFPYSEYISSGRKELGYDPLAIALERAHEKGLYFEAWINPYRISKNDETTDSYKQTKQYTLYKDFIIEYTNSSGETCLSFDPSKNETIELLNDGIIEILDRYDVDGIHFDDYFYVPDMDNELSVEDKKNNVNRLIEKVYDTIHEKSPGCQFGISPAGNLENARNEGADIDLWLSDEGYIDYIMPQIYWSDKYVTDSGVVDMYRQRCDEWNELNHIDIPMYAGLALYRVNESSSNDMGWSEKDTNLALQYEYAYQNGYDGFAIFRYAWLENTDSVNELCNLNTFLDTLPQNADFWYISEDITATDTDAGENSHTVENENDNALSEEMIIKIVYDTIVEVFGILIQ